MATANLPAVHTANGQIQQSSRVQLGGAAAMAQTIEDLNTIRAFVASEMKDGLDFGLIPGTGSKKTLLQPGAQKIFMYFNVYPRISVQTIDLDGGHVEYIVTVELLSRTTQACVGAGVGSCSTMESRYRWRKAARVCPACGAASIIKGKEEYGGGWLCHKKQDGCGQKFRDGDLSIESQPVGRVENADIFDTRNTVLKMAKKRATVDAAHGLGCMSELFTQDLEDFAPVAPQGDHDGRREINEAFGHDDRQGSRPAPHQARPHQPAQPLQNGSHGSPRTGKALFAFIKDQEQQGAEGLLKWVNGLAKDRGFPAKMIDWDADQVAEIAGIVIRELAGQAGEGDRDEPGPDPRDAGEEYPEK